VYKIGNIASQKKINIVGIGILASVLVFLLAYALFARALVLTSFGEGNTLGLLFLVGSLELVAVISSIFVSIWQTDDLPEQTILKTALVAFVLNLIIICVLSYGTLSILYPGIFSGLSIFDMILGFPTVLLYFSIFVLGHPIYLFILSIITYYLLFIIFIEVYYPKKGVKT
jgi:hypothetical protein